MTDNLNQPEIPSPTLPPEPPPGIPTSPLSPKPLQAPTALPGEPPIKSVISPMAPNKKSSKKLILSVIVVFLLLASIPAAVFLVRQRQEFGKKAYEIQCEPDGYIGPGDCDCNTDGCFGVRWHSKCENSQIVDYNEQDSSCDSACTGKCGGCTWDSDCVDGNPCTLDKCVSSNCQHENAPEGTTCERDPSTYQPIKLCDSNGSCSISALGDTLINGCLRKDCDTVNFSPGHLVCIEEWKRPDGSTYEKPGTDTGETCGDSDTLINGCLRKDCDTVNFSPGHLVCIEEWKRPDGSTYTKPGEDTGQTCVATPRSAAKVCQDYGGTQTTSCIADPNCAANGGVCCNKVSVNYCCYGDSQTRQDGACYAGGLQTDITCSGRTMTNNTTKTFTVWRFIGGAQCPLQSPAGEKTLGPGETLTASCEQLEVPGYCGVCDTSACTGPEQPTPSPSVSAQCQSIKVYDINWGLLDATKLSLLQTGDTVRFAVLGQATSGTFNKARFRINSATWLPETTTKKPGTEEFYIEYILPAGVTSFNVEAEIYHQSLGWR